MSVPVPSLHRDCLIVWERERRTSGNKTRLYSARARAAGKGVEDFVRNRRQKRRRVLTHALCVCALRLIRGVPVTLSGTGAREAERLPCTTRSS